MRFRQGRVYVRAMPGGVANHVVTGMVAAFGIFSLALSALADALPPPAPDIDEPLALASVSSFPPDPSASKPIAPPVPDTPDIPTDWGIAPLPPTFGQRLDLLHDETCQTMQHFFDRVDGWFATAGNESLPAVQCPFFVGVETEFVNRGAGIETLYDINFDMKLRLPNFERRLRLFVTTEPLDEFVTAEPTFVDSASEEVHQEFITGIRRQLDQLFDASIGVKAGSDPELFGALKWSHQWHPWDWTVRPSLKGYWTTQQGCGVSGGLLVERWWGPWLLRSASGAKRSEESDGLRWSESVTFGYAQEMIQDRRFGSLAQARDFGRGGGINGTLEGHGDEPEAYGVNVFYRFPVRGKWLYLHVAPEVRWTEERDWALDYGVRVGLDCVFSALCIEPAEDE